MYVCLSYIGLMGHMRLDKDAIMWLIFKSLLAILSDSKTTENCIFLPNLRSPGCQHTIALSHSPLQLMHSMALDSHFLVASFTTALSQIDLL